VTGVGAHRPVVVLAGPIDALERFLVNQAAHAVQSRNPLENAHREHLVIARKIGTLKQRRQLELARCHFVVPRLGRNAKFKEPRLHVGHVCLHVAGDRTKVVVVELMPLRRIGTHDRTAAQVDVRPHRGEILIDQKVLLLDSKRGGDMMHAFVRAEKPQHPHGLLAECFVTSQQRRLLVERLARP